MAPAVTFEPTDLVPDSEQVVVFKSAELARLECRPQHPGVLIGSLQAVELPSPDKPRLPSREIPGRRTWHVGTLLLEVDEGFVMRKTSDMTEGQCRGFPAGTDKRCLQIPIAALSDGSSSSAIMTATIAK